jgi:hypothetical protein
VANAEAITSEDASALWRVLENEAVRIVYKSGKWNPAIAKGRETSSYHIIYFGFYVNWDIEKKMNEQKSQTSDGTAKKMILLNMDKAIQFQTQLIDDLFVFYL